MLKRNFGKRGVVFTPDRMLSSLPVPHRGDALRALRVLENINYFQDEQSRECVAMLERFIDSR